MHGRACSSPGSCNYLFQILMRPVANYILSQAESDPESRGACMHVGQLQTNSHTFFLLINLHIAGVQRDRIPSGPSPQAAEIPSLWETNRFLSRKHGTRTERSHLTAAPTVPRHTPTLKLSDEISNMVSSPACLASSTHSGRAAAHLATEATRR